MPSNFPLGQLSSPTTGIFPGQAPAMGVHSSQSTDAPGVCVYVCTWFKYTLGDTKTLVLVSTCSWEKQSCEVKDFV